jgi:hypothetical protein
VIALAHQAQGGVAQSVYVKGQTDDEGSDDEDDEEGAAAGGGGMDMEDDEMRVPAAPIVSRLSLLVLSRPVVHHRSTQA